MELAYCLEAVLAQVPKLQHGTDGLIYTAVNSKYVPQTDDGMSVLPFHLVVCWAHSINLKA